MVISKEIYDELKARLARHDAWAAQYVQKTGWTVIPADAVPPAGADISNDERSSIEVYEFCNDIPKAYFLYISQENHDAHTWTGEHLGRASFGREFRDNFGGRRVPVTVKAINGRTYHGTFFKSAGDYARVRLAKAEGGA